MCRHAVPPGQCGTGGLVLIEHEDYAPNNDSSVLPAFFEDWVESNPQSNQPTGREHILDPQNVPNV